MLFNSIDFVVFLPIVFILYWLIPKEKIKLQNLLIVGASYFFYAWWDWRYLGLILLSTFVDYAVGVRLASTKSRSSRKALLWVSLLVNLGLLGFFKYYNFFLENFIASFSFFGAELNASSLNLILPVGISFYTFQTLSYTIDVYKGKLDPTRDFIAFSAFVSFFPQLVAGPIERATQLLPQFYQSRSFDYSKAVDGLRQILWGLFKKIVIADNCAEYANLIFNNSDHYSGSTLVLGALFFSFQIYGDFSGYSDIAIGTARLFGFNLSRNFAFPYFSRDIAEFWRRWHISLSTWFRDYLYIPLGGSRGSIALKLRNTFLIFLVSGFWHGANWTFIIWGALNALYFLPLLLGQRNRKHLDIVGSNGNPIKLKELFKILLTFGLTVLAWVFFRAENLEHAFHYILGIFSASLFSLPEILPKTILLLLALFLVIEWLGREDQFALQQFGLKWNKSLRYALYLSLIAALFWFGGKEQQFIYFQF
ncbi:MBOAT family O-acyltransferase [Croceimicrobium hydrocarbonivorans]|uniref:MBOAT family protein n=1 Tax=Croceimicrobium hydrocarbonivorans TaxID=2761580 RepID=A0A7H0VHH9_9FLAO|nr:MBOAT family protein [Croceimicrobium hydrocarbonivorans]QNR25177.1 MBOAT family protein [Croceimicrobium hydrocarbonivorans]